ncbi:hypothetical protein CI109_106763 [Kwoniella shandongensis]|uniref:Uncharacterized protein n=1 Tax=Kwoniella shandongensis TaxID=1734106 RepID=A0AAJ8N0M7_9TREE
MMHHPTLGVDRVRGYTSTTIERFTMPLPVERSQGSVSALVARFQTAADRDKESAARESRRASLQPQSNGGSRRASATNSTTPGVTPKLDQGNGIFSGPGPDVDGVNNTSDGTRATKENGKDGGGRVGDVLHKAGETLKKVEAKVVSAVPITSTSSNKDKRDNKPSDIKVGSSPSTPEPAAKPVVPPKSPKRMSSTGVMSPIVASSDQIPDALSPASPTAMTKEAKPPGKAEKKASSSNANANIPSKVGVSKASTASGASKDKSVPSPRATTAATTPAKTAAATEKKPFPSPSTANGKAPTTTTPSAAKPRSRLSSTTSSNTTPRNRLSNASTTQGQTSTSSAHKTTPSATIPSASQPTKPLTPNATGPLAPRPPRPASSLSPSTSTPHHPSPLKPHLTGTPSKPTASSLAKARSPPASAQQHTPASGEKGPRQSLSLGKASGSGVKVSSRRLGSASPSPASGAGAVKTGERSDTPTRKNTISGNTSSRLLQGTAASRARAAAAAASAAAGHPTSLSQNTPAKSSTTPSKNTTTSTPKTATSASKAKSTPSTKTASTTTPNSAAKVKTNGTPTSTPINAAPERIPPVGRSPIGRLGLAAAGAKKKSALGAGKTGTVVMPKDDAEAATQASQEEGSSSLTEGSKEEVQSEEKEAVAEMKTGEEEKTDTSLQLQEEKEEIERITHHDPKAATSAPTNEEIKSPIPRPVTPPPDAEVQSHIVDNGNALRDGGFGGRDGEEGDESIELEEIPDVE